LVTSAILFIEAKAEIVKIDEKFAPFPSRLACIDTAHKSIHGNISNFNGKYA